MLFSHMEFLTQTPTCSRSRVSHLRAIYVVVKGFVLAASVAPVSDLSLTATVGIFRIPQASYFWGSGTSIASLQAGHILQAGCGNSGLLSRFDTGPNGVPLPSGQWENLQTNLVSKPNPLIALPGDTDTHPCATPS